MSITGRKSMKGSSQGEGFIHLGKGVRGPVSKHCDVILI